MKKILITGQIGRGKTTTALEIIKKHDLEPITFYKEDFLSNERLEKKILAAKITTIFGQKRAILIEDAQEITQKRYIKKINQILSSKNILIILTMTPTNTLLVREYKKSCEELKLKPFPPTKLIEIIKKELKKEINLTQANQLLTTHNQDIRSILIDVKTNLKIEDAIKENTRSIELNITELLTSLRNQTNPQKRMKTLFEKNIEIREILTWILDNTLDKNILSKIDIYEKRIIQNQEFSFRTIQNHLLSHIKILEKFVFPKKLLSLSKIRQNNNNEKIFLTQINEKIHASQVKIKREYLPYLMFISSPS